MLHHRSFKPAKCKTALKLAVSRIKLLKNKREAHVKQLRRELAQLLQSGQDHTARIRVEHVVREQKTMAAYDLIEIYCELIVARLPMIESQKNCPIDLKEAISSVIFASPRCADIPELMDVRKHMMSKYGKEFVSAAVELRPDCGVNRLLVEKLSAKAPDGPTKIKILTAIADEHNVKWQPKSFGDNDVKSSQDLLVGPNTLEKATYVEPPQVHVPPVRDETGPPNLRASYQLKQMHDISTNPYEQNASVAARKAGGDQSTTSGRSNPEIRSSGTGSQEMDFRDSSYVENRSAFPMGRLNWNMEFKDAASAAEAAAESAERASMAARAAAELSNLEKMTRQSSSRSQSSSGGGVRDEVPQEYAFNDDKHLSTGSVGSTFRRSSFGMHNEQINAREQENLVEAPDDYYRTSNENVAKYSQSASLTSSSAFGDDNPFANDSQMADIYQHNYSFKQGNGDFLHEISIKKQTSRTKVDFVTELHADMNTENNDHFGDVGMNRQNSIASSSHFITPSDDHNDHLHLNGRKMGNKATGDLFVTDEGNTQRNYMATSSYNDAAVAFDDSGSEDSESGLIFSSPHGRKSQVDPLTDTNGRSPGQVIDEEESSAISQSYFSVVSKRLTKSAVSSGKEDSLTVTFHDSDGPSSDSEEDLVKSKVSGSFGYGNSVLSAKPAALGTSSRNDKKVGSDRSSWFSPSSVGLDTVEEHFKRKIDITAVSEKNFGYENLPTSQTSFEGRSTVLGLDLKENIHASRSPDTFNNTETLEESHIASRKEFNYGTLQGSLLNKSYRMHKSTSGEGSSSLEDNAVQNEQSLPTVRTSISGTGLGRKSSRVSYESKNQKASSMGKSSDGWASSEHGSAEHASSKLGSVPNRSSCEEIMKSSARVQPSSSLPKTKVPDSEEASKSLNFGVDIPSRPSHVHPKLPDYDSLSAYFLSLKGRQ